MIHIDGSFPSLLYRAFDKEEYAHSFVEQGIFQMRLLSEYCKFEDDNRKDKDEGEGKAVIEMYRPVVTFDKISMGFISQTDEYGPVNFGTGSINPNYILCFSGPQVDLKLLASKFGRYVVCIKQPNIFVSDIANYLEQYPIKPGVMRLDCVQVGYDKGLSVNTLPDPASMEMTRMSYGQKYPKDSEECEYRLVLVMQINGNTPKPEIMIKFHKRLAYAEFCK